MTLTVVQALLIAIWVALVESRILGYATLTLRFSPLMTGFVVGLVTGHVAEAMIVTATIQLIYMGTVAPGGTLPAEPSIAAAIAVSVAIIGNLKPEAAVAIAVPVGLLGSYLYQFRFFLNTFFTRQMDKFAREANDKGLITSIMVIPAVISFCLFVPMLFIALYYGAPAISSVIKSLSNGPVLHILTVVGGGLAALGIAVIMHVIGKKSLLVYFFLAYFVSVALVSLKINTVTYAIIGVALAVLYTQFMKKED
ncbi:PTS system mannose-specific IIC component [Lactovum miscens]|uniref:PTS system mannose-specific IIC component n=2 Tax=Lactovum miscens TaxID=190387 RepID=A0A841C563_9LACT|nr:PTS sugar transporter subunit IIC [Lactovum miscens]MBB5887943.1 PTS system mannose-specific IIC component [Lactovum miscens]